MNQETVVDDRPRLDSFNKRRSWFTVSYKGLGDVQKYYSYMSHVIKSFVPLIKTVKKKSLSGMGRTEARLIGEEKVVGVEVRGQLTLDMFL